MNLEINQRLYDRLTTFSFKSSIWLWMLGVVFLVLSMFFPAPALIVLAAFAFDTVIATALVSLLSYALCRLGVIKVVNDEGSLFWQSFSQEWQEWVKTPLDMEKYENNVEEASALEDRIPDRSKNKIPDKFVCSITHMIMVDPVTRTFTCEKSEKEHTHTFDRVAIKTALEANGGKCPLTHANVSIDDYKPNKELACKIKEWVAQNSLSNFDEDSSQVSLLSPS